MNTEIIKIDKNNIDIDKIKYAAQVIRKGGLVAFPTETVYGLGANALDEAAVKNIFKAKGRPSDNPLIVHISDKNSVHELVDAIPDNASILMDSFWPGPLTIIMKKSNIIPQVISAGLDTVAIRMPSHPVALALIEESGLPIAAPSANISGKPSPTEAKHVIEDLFGKVDIIIDAGSSKIGLESTVIDMTIEPAVILRPGGITPSQLKLFLGDIQIDPAIMTHENKDLKPKSPGMKYTHYSPKADVVVIQGDIEKVLEKVNEMIKSYENEGKKVGILATEQTKSDYNCSEVISLGDREMPHTIASSLFSALRELDERGVEIILAEAIGDSEIGLAVMNRMNKAAGHNIIKV